MFHCLCEIRYFPNISNFQNNWRIRRRHISGSEERKEREREKRDRGEREGEKREGEKRERGRREREKRYSITLSLYHSITLSLYHSIALSLCLLLSPPVSPCLLLFSLVFHVFLCLNSVVPMSQLCLTIWPALFSWARTEPLSAFKTSPGIESQYGRQEDIIMRGFNSNFPRLCRVTLCFFLDQLTCTQQATLYVKDQYTCFCNANFSRDSTIPFLYSVKPKYNSEMIMPSLDQQVLISLVDMDLFCGSLAASKSDEWRFPSSVWMSFYYQWEPAAKHKQLVFSEDLPPILLFLLDTTPYCNVSYTIISDHLFWTSRIEGTIYTKHSIWAHILVCPSQTPSFEHVYTLFF